jgi:hypothetical protein
MFANDKIGSLIWKPIYYMDINTYVYLCME